MLTRLRTLLDRWHQLKSLDALTDRDLDDLGMTRAQVRSFVTMPADTPDRVARMAALFAIPESDLKANHAAYLDLLGTCAQCADRAACARLLQSPAPTPQEARFCPNAPLYADHPITA